jgi:HSP20 family molecular chaperone IbpA
MLLVLLHYTQPVLRKVKRSAKPKLPSFYRSIPIPEEILPSKITARMNNGILQIEIPKKAPSRPAGGSTRIEIG